MDFTKHVFISYCHDDNDKLEGQDQGWVSRFHKTLLVQLKFKLGEKPEIWRDETIRGNDDFSDEILAELAGAALLVSIVSPKYFNSKWCLREAAEFCRLAQQGIGSKVNSKFRVVKILRSPEEKLLPGSMALLPEDYSRQTGHHFFISKEGRVVELDPAYGPDMVSEFNLRMAMLAEDLKDTLLALRQAAGTSQFVETRKGTIFLAETSWDIESNRRLLQAELSSRGYRLLPATNLPSHEDECRAAVQAMLAECDAAIHMVGPNPGMVPNGPHQTSVDEIQNELAAAESKSRKIPRIIWMPSGNSPNSRHQNFLNLLNRDDEMQCGADVIAGDFETLKGSVLAALQKLQQAKEALPPLTDPHCDKPKVYVICDKRDAKANLALRKQVGERGFDVQRNLFDPATAGEIRKHNDKMLAESKIVIIFYGAGDQGWYESTLIEIKKSKTQAPVWTLLAPSITSHKQELLDEFEGGPIIDGMSGDLNPIDLNTSELARMLSVPSASSAGGTA